MPLAPSIHEEQADDQRTENTAFKESFNALRVMLRNLTMIARKYNETNFVVRMIRDVGRPAFFAASSLPLLSNARRRDIPPLKVANRSSARLAASPVRDCARRRVPRNDRRAISPRIRTYRLMRVRS